MTRYTLIASAITVALLSGCSSSEHSENGTDGYQYSSKATYSPQQDLSSYEAAPLGYRVVYTQLVERHGARALSSPKYDVLTKQVWDLAKKRGQLTERGEKLGPVTDKVTGANEKLGYGLLTRVGEEEPEGIASRMAERLSSIMTNDASNPVCIQVQTSGEERANQTAYYFMQSLANDVAYVSNDATRCYQTQTQPNKIDNKLVNKYELYFHKTNPAKSVEYQQYTANYKAYKNFKDSDKLEAAFDEISELPKTKLLARQMLERIYTKEFVDFLENDVSDDKNCDIAAENCFKTNTRKPDETEDDWKYVQNEVDAASKLYNMFIIGPGMLREAQAQGGEWNLKQFITPEESAWFSYQSDAEDFYEKGPSFSDSDGVTYNIAKPLLKDMFSEMDAVANNSQSTQHVAKVRFAHAEQMMPLAALLHVEGSTQSADPSILYSQENNEWRGGWVTPYSANIQWDVYKNVNGGETLVKMLYNEKEVGFKDSCKVFSGTQYFYSLNELKRCYSKELSVNE
ncbi:histidine phosphatase family protein [Vibrio spartinae]|uniref:Multiple inositol polyphosphate phosphatase 1 n=1 Tax=Vibrio spartinae TaxID=1918945 RepID=A0A1N6M3K0_9VIBR|nr:histidine phosphatase family protein [Vibrio spartinae]QMV14510.1 Histidine phosphatase superfamily (branch 2) [Vibrio spartinae]SIO93998.1 Histidine phosphatase superfamily (branch 2) [Vibrio spartinae]